MRRFISIFILSSVLLLPTGPGLAQEGTPIPEEGILVRGFLSNRTTGEPGPEGIEVMLHARDESGAARGMVHAVSGPEGIFEFEGALVEKDVLYAVMARYQGATYFSEAVVADNASQLPEIELLIYETTTNSTEITIDLLHLVIGTGQGGLMVAEFYALSNHGDKTVIDAGVLEQGSETAFVFSLPPQAANVIFPSASPERYRVFPGGFVDTNGISPGAGTSQVIVTYVLPYEDGLALERPVPFDTGEIKIFLPLQIGLQLEVSEGMDKGVEMLGSNDEAYQVYLLGPLQRDDSIELTVTGTLPGIPLLASEGVITNNNVAFGPGMIWGTSILGVALIITGLRWWRRSEEIDTVDDLEPGESAERGTEQD